MTRIQPVFDDSTVDMVDAAGRDSFPASDPPTWSSLRLGSPTEATDVLKDQEKATELIVHRSHKTSEADIGHTRVVREDPRAS